MNMNTSTTSCNENINDQDQNENIAIDHESETNVVTNNNESETNVVTNNNESETNVVNNNIESETHDVNNSSSNDSNQNDIHHNKDEMKERRIPNSIEKKMRTGVYTVSRNNFSNVTCSDTNQLIAKTRGYVSALSPYQDVVGPSSSTIVNNNPNTIPNLILPIHTTPPRTSRVRPNSLCLVDNNIPSPSARSVSNHNDIPVPVVSPQVRRLIAKTRGDPTVLIPFQVDGQSNDIDHQHSLLELEDQDDITPGAYAVVRGNYDNHTAMLEYNSSCSSIDPLGLVVDVAIHDDDDDPKNNANSKENLKKENNNSSGLVIANLVVQNGDDDGNKMLHLPTAVVYDNDKKSNLSLNNRRWYIFIIFIISGIIISILGVALGIIVSQSIPPKQHLTYRETIGIYENIARLINVEELKDKNSPYKKALDWITFDDPLLLTPDHPRFTQRYLLSYFYFATSISGNWTNPCRPDSNKERDDCKYIRLSDYEPPRHLYAYRWLSKQNECDWAGILCDTLSQVSRISLSEMKGMFPHGIMLLPYLQYLNLESGNLSGSISIGSAGKHIAMLNHIDLSNNSFIGTIPEQWFQSRYLHWLDIGLNQFNGSISSDVGMLNDLIKLDVGENELTGSLPNELHHLVNMVYLRLHKNKFHGTIPSSYGQMYGIEIFDISDNRISGSIPKEIGHMEYCFYFMAAHNRLIGQIPETFWNAIRLQVIHIHDNELTGTISNKIRNLKYLTDVSISNNQFTGPLPSRIGHTSIKTHIYDLGLKAFRAYGNQLNGTVPEYLCNLVQDGTLQTLELDCSPTIITDSSSSGNPFDNVAAEIICPKDCCTLCCTLNGTDCKKIK